MNKDILKRSINLMKESVCLLVNGMPCFYNDKQTFDDISDDIPVYIIIDDYLNDDCAFAIKVCDIIEIEILYTAIKIQTIKTSYIINILNIKTLNEE